MRNASGTKPSISRVLSLGLIGLCFSQLAYAERIRHCEYSFSAKASTLNVFAQTVRSEVLLVAGQSAGRHGGVQANTARERARDRIVSCVTSWTSLADNLKSSELGACTNDNISSAPGFDEKTDGKSLREAIADLLPGLCADSDTDEVLVRFSAGSLLVTGDTGCPTTRNFSSEDMLIGQFCQGL